MIAAASGRMKTSSERENMLPTTLLAASNHAACALSGTAKKTAVRERRVKEIFLADCFVKKRCILVYCTMKLSDWVLSTLFLSSDTVVSIVYVPTGAPDFFVPVYLMMKGVLESTETFANPRVASVEVITY